MEDKLSKLEQILGVLDKDTVTQDEFVEMFGVLIDFVGQIQESNDEHMEDVDKKAYEAMEKCMAKMEKSYHSEWMKIKAKVDSLKNGVDGLQGEQGVQGIQGVKGDKGDMGDKGEMGEKGLDLFPNTPNEEVDKINEATNKINSERVKGLKEVVERATINALPITTTHYKRSGIETGRAKNINMIGSRVEMQGDYAIITPIVVSTTAPPNPLYGELWLDIS